MKTAYPVYEDNSPMKPAYNLNKWIDSIKNIYINVHRGFSRTSAVDHETASWPKTEKHDFIDWMKFYEANDHLKYKKAQHTYYVNDDIPGYLLPNPKNIPQPVQQFNIPKLEDVEVPVDKKELEQQKRTKIEDQRKKLLSRLNSVEKLLSSQEGHLFSGTEFEKLLHSIYELKKQIQTVNKISLSTQLYTDLIIRQANLLKNNGYNESSKFLYKFAQNVPGLFNANLGPLPLGSKIDGTGTLENTTPKLENMIEVEDELYSDDVLLEQEILPDDMTVEAQEIQEKKPLLPTDTKVEQAKNIDNIIDSAFANITVKDVITKLEEISKIFQTREISRQLAIVDIMLDSLGLSAYFPMLAEAIHKSFETNQYCLTRIEDVLFRLHGTVTTDHAADLVGNVSTTPEGSKIKHNLEEMQRKEKSRRELRQKVQDKDLEKRLQGPTEKPVVEDVEKELTEKPVTIKPETKPPVTVPAAV